MAASLNRKRGPLIQGLESRAFKIGTPRQGIDGRSFKTGS